MNNADIGSRESGARSRILSTVAAFGALTAFILVLSFLSTGCGKPPKLSDSDEKVAASRGDPWEAAGKRLRKETDFNACKSVLGSLNHELTTGEKADKPAALAKSDEDALAGVVPLHASDRDEIRAAAFSAHDPVYLAECLYLRDAARSLAVPGLSNEQLADLGFAWVCRQVMLDPWLVDIEPGVQMGTAIPTAQILRRGSGSGLERMYVFLALLQQMGLDGCLLGPPGMAGTFAGYVAFTPDKKTVLTGSPRGPFWAVGVRVERDKKAAVKLYDPWRGEAFPATLGELRAKPDSYKTWFEDRAAVSGMTSGDAKGAVVYLAVPVNSLAPRLAMLERKLKQTVDVKLAINPAELRDRFPDPKPTFWNPPEDRFAYGRVARAFMPTDQGGEADRYDPRGRVLHDNYLRSLLPSAERVLPADLLQNQAVIENIKPRIEEMVKNSYAFAFLQPPTPREQIQRGQFQDAARALIERQDVFSKRLLRVRNTEQADKRMRDWVDTAKRLYSSLGPDAAANEVIRSNIDEPLALRRRGSFCRPRGGRGWAGRSRDATRPLPPRTGGTSAIAARACLGR